MLQRASAVGDIRPCARVTLSGWITPNLPQLIPVRSPRIYLRPVAHLHPKR